MLTKAERQEARVTLATTRAGSRYKRELLYSALDSLDEMEEVVRQAKTFATHIPGCDVLVDSRCKCTCFYDNWLKHVRKVIGE